MLRLVFAGVVSRDAVVCRPHMQQFGDMPPVRHGHFIGQEQAACTKLPASFPCLPCLYN